MNEKLKKFKIIEDLYVGVVGAGYAAHLRCRALKKLKNKRLNLASVFDTNLKNSKEFSEEFLLERFDTLDIMLKSSNINTVTICTPNKFHFEIAKKALQNGKNVICEYPLVVDSYNNAEKLFEIADKKNLLIHVGQTMNFDNDLELANEHKKKFGQLLMGYKYMTFGQAGSWLELSGFTGNYSGLGQWYIKKELTGGWMIAACYHGIQIHRKIFGEVISVYAADSSNKNYGAGSVLMKHENNASTIVQWGLPIPGKPFNIMIVTGSNGSVEINDNKYLISTLELTKSGVLKEKDTFFIDSKLLLDKIDGIVDTTASNIDMLRNLKISLLAEKSSKDGKIKIISWGE